MVKEHDQSLRAEARSRNAWSPSGAESREETEADKRCARCPAMRESASLLLGHAWADAGNEQACLCDLRWLWCAKLISAKWPAWYVPTRAARQGGGYASSTQCGTRIWFVPQERRRPESHYHRRSCSPGAKQTTFLICVR